MFDIGFLPIRLWDILDILIVGYLMYQIYKLLRGSIAFNIFVGVILLYVVWWLVGVLQMDILSLILGQFVNVGVIIIIIIFQPEVRRFLLYLGNSTLKGRSGFLFNLLDKDAEINTSKKDKYVKRIYAAILQLSQDKTGALIIFSNNVNVEYFGGSGVFLDARITAPLLESIFQKESPLHDGAVIIANNKIQAAGCVLPVSDNPNLPKSAGLRHRAGVGATEQSNVTAFIVSEETGKISVANKGMLSQKITALQLKKLLFTHYK